MNVMTTNGRSHDGYLNICASSGVIAKTKEPDCQVRTFAFSNSSAISC